MKLLDTLSGAPVPMYKAQDVLNKNWVSSVKRLNLLAILAPRFHPGEDDPLGIQVARMLKSVYPDAQNGRETWQSQHRLDALARLIAMGAIKYIADASELKTILDVFTGPAAKYQALLLITTSLPLGRLDTTQALDLINYNIDYTSERFSALQTQSMKDAKEQYDWKMLGLLRNAIGCINLSQLRDFVKRATEERGAPGCTGCTLGERVDALGFAVIVFEMFKNSVSNRQSDPTNRDGLQVYFDNLFKQTVNKFTAKRDDKYVLFQLTTDDAGMPLVTECKEYPAGSGAPCGGDMRAMCQSDHSCSVSPPPPYTKEPSICTKQRLYAPRALSVLGKCYTQCEKDTATVRPSSEKPSSKLLQNCQKIAGIPFSVPVRDDAEAYAYMSTPVDAYDNMVAINTTCLTAEGIHPTDPTVDWKAAIEKLWVKGPCCDRRPLQGLPMWVPPVMWGQAGSINNDDWDYCGTRFKTEGTLCMCACVYVGLFVCVCVCVCVCVFRV
jgi:hypothetical protein